MVLVMKWSNKVEADETKEKMKWSATIVAKKEMDLTPWLAAIGGGRR